MKRILIETSYKYYFLVEKKYFKISRKSKLKCFECIYQNYSYVDILWNSID